MIEMADTKPEINPEEMKRFKKEVATKGAGLPIREAHEIEKSMQEAGIPTETINKSFDTKLAEIPLEPTEAEQKAKEPKKQSPTPLRDRLGLSGKAEK